MAFKERKIEVTFTLGEGAFGDAVSNTVKLSGLRTSVKIVKAGGPSMSTLQMQVYGMTKSQMDKLSTLGMVVTLQRRNTVTVEAGDDENGMGVVFRGTITSAWMDAQSAPDVPFRVEAHTGLIEAVETLEPSSFTGTAKVSTIMSGLAAKMGLSFENSGVETVLQNPYFYGSPREQAKACAEAAGCEWLIDGTILAIWPAGQYRGGQVPLISKDTGMVGYPSYTSQGIVVRSIFNPSIGFGQKIKIKSTLEPANNEWVVFSLDYDLEALMPGGQWFVTIGAVRPGQVAVK